MKTITLPRLIGSAERADVLVDQLIDTEGALAGKDVCVSFRECRTASPTFIQRLVTRLLWHEEAGRLVVRAIGARHLDLVLKAAQFHGLQAKVLHVDADGWVKLTEDLGVFCICNQEPCVCGAAQRARYLENR